MTKEEVRTICIAKLDLEKDAVLYDIGAGTGSVAVEAACQDGSIRVYAIEKNPEGIELIRKNVQKLRTDNVQIVEDIIDSGRTLAYLIEILKQRNPESIHLCTLLDKPERRVKKQVKVDYTCFEIPDEFVVGFGLDYDQKYRNLPYIGVVEFQ